MLSQMKPLPLPSVHTPALSRSLAALAGTLAISLSSAFGTVLVLGDHTKNTNGDETFSQVFNGGNQLFQFTEGAVYVSFDLTFTNPVLSTSQSFGGYSHSGNDNFGQNWQQSTIGVNFYGERHNIAGQSITPGEKMTLVVKYELNGPGLDGDTVKFWVNPAMGTGVEPTPDDADPSRIWNPASISSDDMRFRRGNAPNDNVMLFENVTVYSGGSSPFIPEPASAVLCGMGLVSFVLRRTRR